MKNRLGFFLLIFLVIPLFSGAETGENLWLRYNLLPEKVLSQYEGLSSVWIEEGGDVLSVARN
mgnify:CR=1 FL=1